MTDADILAALRADLQISSTALDAHLNYLIQTARGMIADEGITLSTSIEDSMLVEMYAAYLYRARRGKLVTMPRFLRWALNNRLMEQKGTADDD